MNANEWWEIWPLPNKHFSDGHQYQATADHCFGGGLNSSSSGELKLYLNRTRSTPIYAWLILFSLCICLVFKKA